MLRRFQRRRVKGYRMPDNTASVCRPGPWGNPYTVGVLREDVPGHPFWCVLRGPRNIPAGSREQAVKLAVRAFRLWCLLRLRKEPNWLAPLRGKNLACFCDVDAPCHADVLLELANR